MIQFRPATRGATPLMLGFAGPSRSGKTFSALRVATGLAGGRPIVLVDTERGRALQYAERFKFLHGELNPPFTSERYLEAIKAAKAAGAGVVIVDSASHEHEGEGGMLEQHEANLERMAGSDFKKRERMQFTAWIKPKAAHNRYVNALLQMGADCHLIFCFRAKDKLLLVKGEQPVSLGWTPICSSRFEYEMSFLVVLPEGSEGRVDLAAQSSGLRDPFQQWIKQGQQLDEQLGQRLAEWASGKPGADATGGTATAGRKQALTAAWRGAGHADDAAAYWLRDEFSGTSPAGLTPEEYERALKRLSDRTPLAKQQQKTSGDALAELDRLAALGCACPDGPSGEHVEECPVRKESA